MTQARKVKQVLSAQPAMDGAGVRLKRAFGNGQVGLFDPYLLLDDFRSDDPEDYIAGFPWHPHRGLETVTYLLQGQMRHEDSLGNNGVLGPGEVQWMSAASGIIHQEMPEQKEGLLHGYQLWVNLPAAHKLGPPRYQEIPADRIATVKLDSGATVRVIAGEFQGRTGPVTDILCDPLYLDITLPPGVKLALEIKAGHTAFGYVIAGTGYFEPGSTTRFGPEQVVLFEREGEALHIRAAGPEESAKAKAKPPTAEAGSLRCLVIAGKPIGEPVAWWGPMVMNTQGELQQAFEEYANGTFVKD